MADKWQAWCLQCLGGGKALGVPTSKKRASVEATGHANMTGHNVTLIKVVPVRKNPATYRARWRSSVVAFGRDAKGQVCVIDIGHGGAEYGYDWPTIAGQFPRQFSPVAITIRTDARVNQQTEMEARRGIGSQWCKIKIGGKWTAPILLNVIGVTLPVDVRAVLFTRSNPPKRLKVRGPALSIPDLHRLKIARQTLKYSDVGARIMGGMTKDEARRVIQELTGKVPRKNAPLKGARAIGSNMTEVEHGDLTILYSYKTPVAFLSPQGGYVTSKSWSVTTSKHIAKFFEMHGYDRRGAFKVPQEDIEMYVATGKGPGENPPRRAQKLRSSGRRRGKRIRQSMRVVARGVEMDIARAFGKLPISTKHGIKRRTRRNPAQPGEGPGQNIRNALQILRNADVDEPVQGVFLGRDEYSAILQRLERALYQVEHGVRGNPLAIYGANPSRGARIVSDLGRVIDIRYKRKDDGLYYKHPFKKRPRLLALSDGTIAVRP